MKAIATHILATGLLAAAVPAEAETPWLRTDDPLVATLVTRGLDGSEKFRRLYERLEQSDLIVHVRRGTTVPQGTAYNQFITHAGSYRFVWITLNDAEAEDEAVALLGHEFQHAVELANAPAVDDDTDYQRLFDRIGYQSCSRASPRCYETAEAVRTGREVLRELKRAPLGVGAALGAAHVLGRWLAQAGGLAAAAATAPPAQQASPTDGSMRPK
jgi:hypothetical protein